MPSNLPSKLPLTSVKGSPPAGTHHSTQGARLKGSTQMDGTAGPEPKI